MPSRGPASLFSRTIWRVQFRQRYESGSGNRYYTNETKSRQFAKKCKKDGTLISYARYDLTTEITV